MSSKIVSHTELCEMGEFGRRNTVYNYLREKDCPSVKKDGKWFVDLEEFKKWYDCKMKSNKLNKNITKTTGGQEDD